MAAVSSLGRRIDHLTSFVESTGQTDIWVTLDSTFDSRSKLLHGTMQTNPLFNQSHVAPLGAIGGQFQSLRSDEGRR